MRVDLLDHGFARLVDHMGNDLSIVKAARVSYDADWRAGDDEEGDTKLIRYLMKNNHTTPFEAVTLTIESKAPIFVYRQWHRHRTQSYNELSARYKELPEEFYMPSLHEVGKQSANSKQARDLGESISDEDRKLLEEGLEHYKAACESSFMMYQRFLRIGFPRELARAVLPLSTYSHMFSTMNLHNLFHFLQLRLHKHAQYEIRVYAEAMLTFARKVAPVAAQAFVDYKLGGTND